MHFFTLLATILLMACHQPDSSRSKPTSSDADPIYGHTSAACTKGLEETKADEKKGVIGYYFWGIANPALARTLEKKYGFKIYLKGCVVNAEDGQTWSCYNDYMTTVIKQKYQQDIIAIETEKEHRNAQKRIKHLPASDF